MADWRKAPAGQGQRTTLNARTTQHVYDQVKQAAADTNMTMSDWIRFVVASALELHKEQMEELEREEREGPGQVPQASDPDYEQKVEEAAAEERKRLRTGKSERRRAAKGPKPEKLSTRECPHLPKDRRGPKCARCGMQIGRMLTSTRGERFGV
jgi:hypothetical protein